MLNSIQRYGFFVLGSLVGGGIIGSWEALYRGVEVCYSALAYACLWCIGALLCVLCLAVVRPVSGRDNTYHIFAEGLAFSIIPSVIVLGRFILMRDVFLEAPGTGLWASLGAACLALLSGVLIWLGAGLFAWPRRYSAPSWTPWYGNMICLILFILRASTPPAETPTPHHRKEVHATQAKGVILIIADTLRADALGAYGAKAHRDAAATPYLDKFSQQALVFNHMSAQASWTKPAMASIMTSRHVSGHQTMAKTSVLPETLPTIASILKEKSIQTGAVVTNYNLDSSFGFARGFDHFDYLEPDRYLNAPPRANKLALYNIFRLLKERLLPQTRKARHFYQSGREVNARGLKILASFQKKPERPFFLWLHYMEPHDPYFSAEGPSYARVSHPHPPKQWAVPMKKAYRDDVHRFDQFFGSLLEQLDALNLRHKVHIIVASDHGEEFYEHSGFYHGTTLYEEQIHLPLMMSGVTLSPGVDTAIARQIDLAPTIVALFGHSAPESWEGRDLLGDSTPALYSLAQEDHQGNRLSSIQVDDDNHRYKLIEANTNNPRGLPEHELFELNHDPEEKAPLSTEALIERLKTLRQKAEQESSQNQAAKNLRALDTAAEAELRALGYIE
jgi:arylsulfatase A-like enzyme